MRVHGLIVAIAISSTSLRSHANPADKARADKLFEDGRKYLAAKEYALACTAFEQSQVSDPAIGTELNLALCYEQWGKVASASRAYVEAERLALAKKDKRAKSARKKVDELEPQIPHLVLEIPPDADPSVVFLLDSQELARDKLFEELLLDPGPHQVEARMPGKPPRAFAVELKPGEHRRLVIDLPRPPIAVPVPVVVVVASEPRSKGKLYGGIALTAAGGIALVTGAVVALAARQDYARNVQQCPALLCTTREAYDATQQARSRANLMTIVGVGGLALAGVGIYLIVASKGAPAERHARVLPLLAPDAIGVAIGGAL